MRRTVALGIVALFLMGCAESNAAEQKIPLSAGAPAAAAGAADPMAGGTVTGILREQIAAGPYVYLRLEARNGAVWAAVNQASLTIGDEVTVYNAMLMERFESPSLKRTFDQIYFGSLEAPGAAAAGSPHGGGADAAPQSTGTPPVADAKVAAVPKATGANARTIAELWTQKDQLADKAVTIRGTVVKYNPEVMGKNWIHLQDGSGDAAKGTHDITVTSLDGTTMGETITITGTVRVNRDFGGGYTYALIVEDAKIVK